MSTKVEPWIQTWLCKKFDLLDPRPEAIDVRDIAHHLSNVNRYTGATFWPYSVAEHSVRVAVFLENSGAPNARDLARWGLMHDASEAYLNDIAAPLKRLPQMAGYRELEKSVQAAVCQRFGLPLEQPAEVGHADRVLLSTEKRDLLGPPPASWGEWPEPLPEVIVPVSHRQAETDFLSAFKFLFPGVA